MINKKKVFGSISTLALSAVAGAGLALIPASSAFADHHETSGDNGCSGAHDSKSCSGEKGSKSCSGEKGSKSCSGHKDDGHGEHHDGDDKGCSGEKGCGGEK